MLVFLYVNQNPVINCHNIFPFRCQFSQQKMEGLFIKEFYIVPSWHDCYLWSYLHALIDIIFLGIDTRRFCLGSILISGKMLPLLSAVKSLSNHIWDVLSNVPSFQSEYGVILRHLLAVRDYRFHMRKRIYCSEFFF